jgi:hypothetical protein
MEKFDLNQNKALVVIDAMRGFTSKGTFGKAFGKEDSMPIDETFEKLQNFIDVKGGVLKTRCLIKSVYPTGKFIQDQNSPLYHLCEKGSSDLEDAIRINGLWYTVQKAENDATSEANFVDWINQSIIQGAKDGVIVTGCTLTTCLSQTAMGIKRILDHANKERTDIIAPLSLIGSRKSHGHKGVDGKSRIDLVVEKMRDKGIKVTDKL